MEASAGGRRRLERRQMRLKWINSQALPSLRHSTIHHHGDGHHATLLFPLIRRDGTPAHKTRVLSNVSSAMDDYRRLLCHGDPSTRRRSPGRSGDQRR
ncbi:hypothetical protein D4764_18G0009820 [Takifugu flavidus]|uniref:Uncharacterized protein n=1 Tax=Takifugu flavidus TaxID=433684 RepID=A0A5C6NT70_9TELE|nr:hypothetical protein D4764_18G0009820 [Takifugu flavidus]